MNTEKFTAKGKEVTLFHAEAAGQPLVIFNSFGDEGEAVWKAARQLGDKDFNLVSIGIQDWNGDMSPWQCPPIMPQDSPYTGGADAHLKLILDEILPETLKRVEGTPAHVSIAGYSLAGLFALYALYKTDVFSRAASMSGSFWFPDFRDFVFSHEMKVKPEKVYISLGNKEAKTRNPYMRTVQENTEAVVEFYRSSGIDVTWEMNPGNHFRDAELRSARGILAIV